MVSPRLHVAVADHSLFSVPGAGANTTGGPWTDFPEWSMRGVSYGPNEPADTAPVIFGGSVGMGPLLAVMQYYRTVARPSFTPPRK